MAKFEPWKRNMEVAPDFPWHSYRNEEGVITYCIPLECPNHIPVDNSEGAEKYVYSDLQLFGGKHLKVRWAETTNREWAFDQKRWIDAEAKRNERRPKHETLVEEVLGDGSSEKSPKKEWALLDGSADDEPTDGAQEQQESAEEDNSKPKDQRETREEVEYELDAAMEKWEPIDVPDDQQDETPETEDKRRKRISDYAPYRFPQTEAHAITLMELESVTEYIKGKNPKWWKVFYLKEWCGVSAEEIAEKLHVNPSRIYQLVDSVQKLGKRYRKENW